jgi:hypothetical protein
MNEAPVTYRELFSLLVSLGFRRQDGARETSGPRVFYHEETDTLLAFRRGIDEVVTPADILSTDVHLNANHIVDRPIASLLNAVSVAE